MMKTIKKDNNEMPLYIVYIQSKTGDQVGYGFLSLKKAEKNVAMLREQLFSDGASTGNVVILKSFLIQ